MKHFIIISIIFILATPSVFAYSLTNSNHQTNSPTISTTDNKILLARRGSKKSAKKSVTSSTKKDTKQEKETSSKKGFFGGMLGGLLGGALLGSIFGSAFNGGLGTILMFIIVIGIAFIIYKMYKSKKNTNIERIVEDRLREERNKDFIHVDPKN